jgi:hypothetical protein
MLVNPPWQPVNQPLFDRFRWGEDIAYCHGFWQVLQRWYCYVGDLRYMPFVREKMAWFT